MCASSRRAESSRSQNVTKAIDNGRDGARFRKVSVYRSTLWDPLWVTRTRHKFVALLSTLSSNLLFSSLSPPPPDPRGAYHKGDEMSGKEGQGKGEWNHPRDQYGNDARLPSPLAIRDVTMLSVSLFYAIANMPESSSPLWTRFIVHPPLSSHLLSAFRFSPSFSEVSRRMAPPPTLLDLIIIVSRWKKRWFSLITLE